MAHYIRVLLTLGSWLVLVAASVIAEEKKAESKIQSGRDDTPANVLSNEEWKRVDVAVNRALTWLAASQQPDGSFPTLDSGQPAVTCLCTMAFMAHGHMADEGKYGNQLERATEYAIGCQKANGLITLVGLNGPEIARDVEHDIGV